MATLLLWSGKGKPGKSKLCGLVLCSMSTDLKQLAIADTEGTGGDMEVSPPQGGETAKVPGYIDCREDQERQAKLKLLKKVLVSEKERAASVSQSLGSVSYMPKMHVRVRLRVVATIKVHKLMGEIGYTQCVSGVSTRKPPERGERGLHHHLEEHTHTVCVWVCTPEILYHREDQDETVRQPRERVWFATVQLQT